MTKGIIQRLRLFFCVTVLFLLLLITAGCRQSGVPTAPGTVALVNGTEITTEDIQWVVVQREIESAAASFLLEQEGVALEIPGERRSDYEKLVRRLGLEPDQLTREQDYSLRSYFHALCLFEHAELTPGHEQFFQRVIREFPTGGMDENVAFNQLARQVVTYQKAVEYGHEVDLDGAREILAQAGDLEQGMPDELRVQMEETRRLEMEILRGYGYASREKWREVNLSRYARQMTIARLQEEFFAAVNERNPEAVGLESWLLGENAWEDYTEQLVRHADISILDDRFELVYYREDHGEHWFDVWRGAKEAVEKTRQRADFTLGVGSAAAEMAATASTIGQRLRHLGAERISVAVDGHRLQVEAWWEGDIPWAQLARRGVLQIGLDRELALTNAHLKKAVAERRPMTSSYSVLLEFNDQGTELFAELTRANMGRRLPIQVDGTPLANPVVQGPITDGRAVITMPDWDETEIKALAAVLSTEPLPKGLAVPATE